MIIKNININNFGKLKNFSMNPSDGLTIIYGENEKGKSTLMAFIKLMFYGTGVRTSDLSKNLRMKYSPWDGSKMSGSIEFGQEGQKFRLEKIFGATPSTDVVKLWNISTGVMEPQNLSKEAGRRFFGLGEAAFEKSVFIGQAGNVISQDKNKDNENEIIKRLLNLVSSGDELQSYDLIDARLSVAIEKLNARGGKIGTIDRLKRERANLEEEKNAAIVRDEKRVLMQNSYEELCIKKEAHNERFVAKANEIEICERYIAFNEAKKTLNKNKILDDLAKGQEKFNELITNADFTATIPFIDEISNRLLICQENNAMLSVMRSEFSEKQLLYSQLQLQIGLKITNENFKKANILNNQISAIKSSVEKKITNIAKEEYTFKEASFFNENLQSLRNKTNELILKTSKINDSLNEYKVADISKNKKRWLIIFSGLTLLFIISGIFIHPLLFVSAVFGFIALPYSSFKYQKRKHHINEYFRNEKLKKERYERDLEQLLFYSNELKLAQKKLSEQEELGKFYSSPNDIHEYIETLKTDHAKMQNEISNLESDYFTILESFKVENIDELQREYFNSQNEQNKIAIIEKEISEKANALDFAIKDYLKNESELFNYASKIRKVSDLDEVKILVEELVPAIFQSANHKEKIQDAKNELTMLLGSKCIEDVKRASEEYKESSEYSYYESLENNISGVDIKIIQNSIEGIRLEITSIEIEMTKTKSEMLHIFIDKPELSLIEKQIDENEKQTFFYNKQLDALKMAKLELSKAFAIMQQTFGPMVNKRTGEILSNITGGKYNDLLVAKDLTISFRDPASHVTMDWQYLSNGTADQAYFSLRLAISELLADQTGGIPLFIDDAFLQYDDQRTKQSLKFLGEYAKQRQIQILFFTCHESLLELCDRETTKAFFNR